MKNLFDENQLPQGGYAKATAQIFCKDKRMKASRFYFLGGGGGGGCLKEK